MERALEKIRPHTTSNLAHQKTPAILLLALESTLTDQNADKTPTAYFAVLLTTLEGTIQKNDTGMGEGDILPGVLYLLALVMPFVPQPVLQSNLSTILDLTAPLFPSLHQHAPALRSQLTIYLSIFLSLDRTQVEIQGIRQAFASILQICLDPRPKVRKKAADLVKDVLSHPPTPLLRHPYADRVADWVKGALAEISQGPLVRAKQGKAPAASGDHAIHLLAFLRPVLTLLPPSSLAAICTQLLALPRLGSSYLSQSAYSILSDLCTIEDDEDSHPTASAIPEVIKAILSFPPARSDSSLSCAWIHLIGIAMLAYRHTCQSDWSTEVGKAWKTVWVFLESKESTVRKEAAHTLSVLSSSFNLEMVERAGSDSSSAVGKFIAQASQALDSLAYSQCIPEVLSVIAALITNVASVHPASTEALFASVIQHVGKLRTEKAFEHKEAADATLSTAMSAMGPEVILRLLPLNLEPQDRTNGNSARAYLLPLLIQPHPSPLGHFVSYFVPLSERMFDYQQKAEIDGRGSVGKVWDVLVAQTWAGFAGYCHGTPDLDTALTAQFSQLISQLLYGQPSLRAAIVKGLKTMVDSNIAISESKPTANPSQITPDRARQNLQFLRTQAESWLSVFFNVFGSVGRDSRNTIGDLIASWVSIAGDENVAKAYQKVIGLFKSNLHQADQPRHGQDDNLLITTCDLLIILLPAVSATDAQNMFELCLTQTVLCAKDNAVQKRAYKILGRLVESGKITVDAAAIIQRLAEWSDGLLPAAKKDRCALLSGLVSRLEPSALHVIPVLIPEAVLGTKEPSDKARTAAFDLILAMGRKMSEGGIVKRDMIDGMEEEHSQAANASIEEFMMMMAGGLAGATPHMISATVTAISRVVFEFKDQISAQMHSEIFTTLLVFLSSANREIVKSILGFIKLAIHSLSIGIIRPYLKDLVPALLSWSHDHKNHFKAKVRHIFERMLRRFTWDEVYSAAGDDEAAKVLVNIKKRKERAKRKKANREEDSEEEAEAPKATTGDAFEDVLYGSESELDDSDDEQDESKSKAKTSTRKFEGARIRMDNDEPMDLLHGAASRVTTASNSRRRKPGQEASKFKTDEDTGKMIIDGEGDDEGEGQTGGDAVAGDAYRETITSVDGFTRGPNGRIKFNKDTKKRRREDEAANEDVDMADGDVNKAPKAKRRSDVKLGQEFKAKKAGGDVMKGKVDPYAYVSLSQASKRGGKKGRIGIAGKR